jgi:hypothetical protein
MTYRTRTPIAKTREFLDELNKKGQLTKYDMYCIAGNQPQFDGWVTHFLLHHGFGEEIRKGRITFYKKTSDGERLHETLKNHKIVVAYLRISGRRLKREKDIIRQ